MTEIGPVDLMCRDCDDGWVAVEIKRVGTIEAVEQLTRYLGFIRADPAKAGCRGILAAQSFKPQAVTLAESRGLACVQVDLAVLRGERRPRLTLFGWSVPSSSGSPSSYSSTSIRPITPSPRQAILFERGYQHMSFGLRVP